MHFEHLSPQIKKTNICEIFNITLLNQCAAPDQRLEQKIMSTKNAFWWLYCTYYKVFEFILNGWNLYFNNPFDQCAQCQNKAAALTIFSKMGAKNREHNECILMTLFALWEEGIFAKNEQEIIFLTAKHSCKAGTFYTPSNEQWCIFIISLTVKIYWLFH